MRNDLVPVKIDMVPPAEAMELMGVLSKNQFQNPVTFGGSLRDTFRKAAYNDLDVRAGLLAEDLGQSTLGQRATAILRSIPEIDILKHTQCSILGDADTSENSYGGSMIGVERFRINFKRSVSADLTIMPGRPDTSFISLSGDAPINSIATDMSGIVLAHPDFEEDMDHGIYYLLRDSKKEQAKSVKRFHNISTRFPGLVLEGLSYPLL